MDIDKLLSFYPQIVEPEYGPEPSLKDMLLQYYLRSMNMKEALKCVADYMKALHKETF